MQFDNGNGDKQGKGRQLSCRSRSMFTESGMGSGLVSLIQPSVHRKGDPILVMFRLVRAMMRTCVLRYRLGSTSGELLPV
jgi:hypothetical protein